MKETETSENVENRLRRIEAGVEELRHLAVKESKQEKEQKKKNSRTTITIAFAALGAKLGAVAGKIFFLKDSWKELTQTNVYADFTAQNADKPLGIKTWNGVDLLLRHTFEEKNAWLKIGLKVVVVGTIGAAIGAAIGWARGDRIEDVHDLFKHPVASLKKLFGPKPPPPKEEAPESAKAITEATNQEQTTKEAASQSENKPAQREWESSLSREKEGANALQM